VRRDSAHQRSRRAPGPLPQRLPADRAARAESPGGVLHRALRHGPPVPSRAPDPRRGRQQRVPLRRSQPQHGAPGGDRHDLAHRPPDHLSRRSPGIAGAASGPPRARGRSGGRLRPPVSAISRALTLGVAASAAARGLPAQGAGASVVRGVELFQLMGREPLARTTGTTRLQWLPTGMGYLESELDSAGGRAFYKVNPATGARAPLFDPVTTARIASEYARLTGRAAKGLPFNDFTFEWGTRAIQFAAGGDRFLYELERRELRR